MHPTKKRLSKLVRVAQETWYTLPIGGEVIEQPWGMNARMKVWPQRKLLNLGKSDTIPHHSASFRILVEVDTVLADRLRERFVRNDRVQVITADFLALDLATAFPEPVIHVVASLPYNVAAPILFHLLDHRHRFPEVTVMIQKEVAERLSAVPGTKAYGVPSVLTQLYATVTRVCTVGPQSFFPAPKVESQVVRLVFQEAPRVAVHDERVFRRVVKAAFAQRRKTLRAAGYRDLDAARERTGIDLQRRGETLSLEEFAALAGVFAEQERSLVLTGYSV